MNRILAVPLLLMMAVSALAMDRPPADPDREQISIATTGRIVRIDQKNMTLRVRASDASSTHSLPDVKLSLWQRIGTSLPHGITIGLPGRTIRIASKSPSGVVLTNEYTVVTTCDTRFQDGSDTITFEDFRSGETVSIHGVLNGSIITASRIAKWD